MTREEYKRAKRRWILQPIIGIAVTVILILCAECACCAIGMGGL